MEGDIFGVRIIPPILQFLDTAPHTLCKLPITVMNISKTSKSIRYYGPKSELELATNSALACIPHFSLKVTNPEEAVAPGLGITAMVEYCPMVEQEHKDRLILTVDRNVIEVPIFAYPRQPMMELTDVVDFGQLVASSKAAVADIILANKGSKAGQFKFKYGGNKYLSFDPSSGTVPAGKQQIIRVEYIASTAGKFHEEAEVHLEGREVMNVLVKGSVFEKSLQLLSVHGENAKVDCIRFGSTYYGTDKIECALLFNNGPHTISFVAVINESGLAQELGVDLSKTTSAALASEGEEDKRGQINEITSIMAAIPNQGVLQPYQKTPMYFRFSPRWLASKQGWQNLVCPPPRKDFAIFLRLQTVGSSIGFMEQESGFHRVAKTDPHSDYAEVALTGTALPVMLSISPTNKLDFGECATGEHADILCTVKNESNALPALFEFRRVAHFSTHPSSGKILPGQTQDVIISFSPKQVGSFKSEQFMDVLGQISDRINPMIVFSQTVHSLPIRLSGSSSPVTVFPKPKFNPGITPYITHEVGMYVETTFKDLQENVLRNAVAGANKTKRHHLKNLTNSTDGDVRVAFPNDTARSIRPVHFKDRFKTLFTRAPRHTYVDPDYAFDEEEIEKRIKHDLEYLAHIHDRRKKRLEKKENREAKKTDNAVDIGIKPAAGIFPKKLKQAEIVPDSVSSPLPNTEWKILSTKDLAASEQLVTSKPVCEGLKPIPTTEAERKDCAKLLSPQELFKIVIGPPVIDIGQVCVGSLCQKEIKIVNNLAQYIHVVAEIDCVELRQSSPLSQVVPPLSQALIPIIFESDTKGSFQRSVVYTVNGFHRHHVTVKAEVVAVALDLYPAHIFLKPASGMPAEAGYRGVVTLTNKLNYPAEFTWSPELGELGTAFSIRPASGVVDAMSELACEVVWHPSFLAPEEGSFTLFISGGESRKLTCTAEIGNTNVFFADQRISFGTAPINLSTIISSHVHNTGNNHAYFYIVDPMPTEYLSVSPVSGVIPVGGSVEIKVALTADTIVKFDTKVMLAVRGDKTLELRVSGSVELPYISIDVNSFNFGGVYCGSSATIPFKLINKASSKSRVEGDLTKYVDFSINFPGCHTQEDLDFQLNNPGKVSVTLDAAETIEGEITFTPQQVAAYDFQLPLSVNFLQASRLLQLAVVQNMESISSVNAESQSSYRNTSLIKPTSRLPHKQVQATATRQPLQLHTNRLEFCLPSNFFENKNKENLQANTCQDIWITNISSQGVSWSLDLSLSSSLLDKGIFKFAIDKTAFTFKDRNEVIEGHLKPGELQKVQVTFCPAAAGCYHITIPVSINSAHDKPFQFLEIFGELQAPKVWFEPASLELIPAPLNTEVSAEFKVLAQNYTFPSVLTVTLPTTESDDDSKVSPLNVTFLGSNMIKSTDPASPNEVQSSPYQLECKLTFSSPKPVSFCQPVIFTDVKGNKFQLLVTATADNSLLTCYPFLAKHMGDYHIVCEQDTLPKGCKEGSKARNNDRKDSVKSGEAMLISNMSLEHPKSNSRPSTSTTSATFQPSSSSYETSSVLSDGGSAFTESVGALGVQKPTTSAGSVKQMSLESEAHLARPVIFPSEVTEDGLFCSEVVLAIQRWFTSQGWPGGPYPIKIPESLRNTISKKTTQPEAVKVTDSSPSKTQLKLKNKHKVSFNRMTKTIYEMISYLSGRSLPGIPANISLPSNPVERVRQVHWQHSTLLTFLRCQGACVAAILPEHLMTPEDFLLWRQLQETVRMELMQEGNLKDAEKIRTFKDVDENLFESISKKAWTDVLLQIWKVFVLAKVTPKSLKNLSIAERDIYMPSVNSNPLSSNIYSPGERVLLAWMNFHYESQRTVIWEESSEGKVPAARWILNFDHDLMDGLVLACLVGAHLPFLNKTHLQAMYTSPSTAAQCLHNALELVTALRYVGIDYDIQAIDITDPNPISLLLFVTHLYDRLPQYTSKTTVEFTGSLHAVVTRQVKVTNSSPRGLVYNVLLAGRDATDFTVPKGNLLTVPAKSTIVLTVEFKSRFLRSAEAVLLLVGKKQGAVSGTTLVFNLSTIIENIKPKATLRLESPCYELEQIVLEVKNPFIQDGEFQVFLIESTQTSSDTRLAHGPRHKELPSQVSLNKKKLDSQTDVIPMNKILQHQESMSVKNSQIPTLQAFHINTKTILLEALGTGRILIDLLPFHVGERQCSVILLNEQIGEFLYSVEAKVLDPLPSYLPYIPNRSSARISSSAAGYGGEKNNSTIYWRCEAGVMLKESLHIPVSNQAKEKALTIAAQQQMSALEMQRRQITGTLMSCTVMAKTLKHLSNNPAAAVALAKSMGPVAEVYKVEVDSEFFQVPDMLVMPNSQDNQSECKADQKAIPKDKNLPSGVAELTVQFKAKDPGIYSANITLTAIDDVRIYRIECSVIPPDSTPELEFATPAFSEVSQNIPITNTTDANWVMLATLSGHGFHGPSHFYIKPFSTAYYKLTFRPLKEGVVTGKLVLINKNDLSFEKVFELLGKGEEPLALDQLQLTCGAKTSLHYPVKVPNVTSKKLTFRVESDLPFISGDSTITVLPNQTGNYDLVLTPNRSGKFKGVLAFICGEICNVKNESDCNNLHKDLSSSDTFGCRMWYSLDIDVKPPIPEKTLTITCPCFRKTLMEVIVRNPTHKELTLKVSVRGFQISGPLSITLGPGTKDAYVLTYAPTQVMESKGSLSFFHEDVGEFWYNLVLKAEPPTPTTLPHIFSELGSWTKQSITLENPTEESLDLLPFVSNTNNFALELTPDKPLTIKANSTVKVNLRFRPSNLGDQNHTSNIVFSCDQLWDWVFLASGTGLLPKTQNTVMANSLVGSSSTFFISFKNPTDLPVLIDVTLAKQEPVATKQLEQISKEELPFRLLLKQTSDIPLAPKACQEIPIIYAPMDKMTYAAVCTLSMRREDGKLWPSVPQDGPGNEFKPQPAGIRDIQWLFPLCGNTEPVTSLSATSGSAISGTPGDVVTRRFKVSLSRPVSKSASSLNNTQMTVKKRSSLLKQSVTHARAVQDFSLHVVCHTQDGQEKLDKCLQLSLEILLVESGSTFLVFDVRFSPLEVMDFPAELVVSALSGEVWKFPVRFIATDSSIDGPIHDNTTDDRTTDVNTTDYRTTDVNTTDYRTTDVNNVDDTIIIEANGLLKPSYVGLRLNSHEPQSSDFKAFFENGSDPEFSVTPESGELPPLGSTGTQLTVKFVPCKYGKLYRARLIVQTTSSLWRYEVRAALPEYHPPRGISARPMAGPHPRVELLSTSRNFIQENKKLIVTAVSSPIKGANLVPITMARGQSYTSA